MRGEGGVAGEGRVVGVPKFHFWGPLIFILGCNFLVIVHVIISRGSEGGSTDIARESGREYTKMHAAMTKGSFQAWGDMQPTDLCLVCQDFFITLHVSQTMNSKTKQNSDSRIIHGGTENK